MHHILLADYIKLIEEDEKRCSEFDFDAYNNANYYKQEAHQYVTMYVICLVPLFLVIGISLVYYLNIFFYSFALFEIYFLAMVLYYYNKNKNIITTKEYELARLYCLEGKLKMLLKTFGYRGKDDYKRLLNEILILEQTKNPSIEVINTLIAVIQTCIVPIVVSILTVLLTEFRWIDSVFKTAVFIFATIVIVTLIYLFIDMYRIKKNKNIFGLTRFKEDLLYFIDE